MSKCIWIDTHIHVSNFTPEGTPRGDLLDDLLAVLDDSGADLRFVVSCDGAELGRIIDDPLGVYESNRFIYELVRQAPGRLYGSCMVNPNFLEESLRVMNACFGEWGFVQLGEMLQYMMNYEMNSPAVEEIVGLAADFNMPVQVHISTSNRQEHPSSFGMEQLLDLFALAERVPQANYILAHAVGMPDDNPPVVNQYLDAIEERFACWPDNFWMEIRDFDSPGVRSALARVPTTRLLAGTDWTTRVGPPFLPYGCIFGVHSADENPFVPSVSQMRALLSRAGASPTTVERIAYKNAADLLGLSVSNAH